MTAAGQRGEAGLLVINTKFANAAVLDGSGGVGQDRDEKPVAGLLRVKYAPRGVDVDQLAGTDLQVYKRALRWRRLHVVQHMLSGLRYGKGMEVKQVRVSKCLRVKIKPHAEIWKSEKYKRAFYGGLMVCGSVWPCPICAAKITERRKNEIEQAPRINEYSKFMVTFTIQHSKHDRLRALIGDLLAGLRDMKNSRTYKNIFGKDGELQIIGSITGTENTVSNVNGWHPHKHALYFSTLKQSEINADEIQKILSGLFVDAMKKHNRYVHAQIGVDVKTDNVVATYVAKMGEGEKTSHWTIASEIAKSPVKTGRDENHFHPFELVDMYATGNMEAAGLFKEYVKATRGVNQLRYSKGLRARLGITAAEQTDQEIAENIEDDAYLFAQLSDEDWKIITKFEKRGVLLEVASMSSYEAVQVYLRSLACSDLKTKGGESLG